MSSLAVVAMGARGCPRWLWRLTAGDLRVRHGDSTDRVPWFTTKRVEVLDPSEVLTFDFVASRQLWARSPRVPVESVVGRVLVYRASWIPMLFRPRVTVRDDDPSAAERPSHG
jgi:hypothetical protein